MLLLSKLQPNISWRKTVSSCRTTFLTTKAYDLVASGTILVHFVKIKCHVLYKDVGTSVKVHCFQLVG